MTTTSPDRRSEVRALSELGLTELSKASAGIGATHRAVAGRIFGVLRRPLGRTVAPVQLVHDAIAGGTYRIVEDQLAAAGRVSGRIADLPLRSAVSETTVGAGVIGVVNGLIGDELDGHASPLTHDNLSLRVAGRAVPVTADGLAAAFPRATGRIAVFLHGLVETEHAWRVGQKTSAPYEHRLWASGVTSVFVRYNTGRHISTNGQDLAEVLDELVRCWPVPATELILIGHSMGGLVARSAVHHGGRAEQDWTRRVAVTVSLGTPHLGAPLEQLAHYASAALTRFPETDAVGRLLRRRSGGIRDLRGGSLVDADWTGYDPDKLGEALAAEIPLPPGADHYFVAATLARDPRHPVSRLLGDGMVLHRSASGRTSSRQIGLHPDNGLHLGRANHFTLLNNAQIGDQLVEWIG